MNNPRANLPVATDPLLRGDTSTSTPALPVHSRTIFEMRDGVPVPIQVEVVGKRNLEYEKSTQLSKPYQPQVNPHTGEMLPGEEAYIGMTKFEVGVLRMADRFANGDPDTYKYFEDRVLGKAKQQVEATTTSMNFFSWVDETMKATPTNPTQIVDVEVHQTPPDAPTTNENQASLIATTPNLLKLIEGL